MSLKESPPDTTNFAKAAEILRSQWQAVVAEASVNPDLDYVDDMNLRLAIRSSINHKTVAYRFCLPIQLLGKLSNPALDCLRLQKKKGDPEDVTGWDARTLGRKVVAPFNQEEENVLGTSSDPYVGNPMRIPRMVRDDQSKRDVLGWNTLVNVLEQVELRADPLFTETAFRQVLLEIFQRQRSLDLDRY